MAWSSLTVCRDGGTRRGIEAPGSRGPGRRLANFKLATRRTRRLLRPRVAPPGPGAAGGSCGITDGITAECNGPAGNDLT
jgi:hypothetical protein